MIRAGSQGATVTAIEVARYLLVRRRVAGNAKDH